MKHRHWLFLVVVYTVLGALLLCAVPHRPLFAQQDGSSKATNVFQAVYIYNFARYVYFPPAKTSGDYIIGVFGKTEMLSSLERMAAIKKTPLTNQTIRIVAFDSPEQSMSECHLIYIPDKVATRIPQIMKFIKGQPTLIITDGNVNISGIPAISMGNQGEKKFLVNNKAIEEVNLKVSADFLRFAALVQ